MRKESSKWGDDMQRPLLAAVSLVFLTFGPVDMHKNMRGLFYRVLSMMDTTAPMIVGWAKGGRGR